MSDRMPPLPASLAGAVDLSSLTAPRREPAKAAATTESSTDAGGLVVNVTDAEFAQVLELSNTVPVILDFWATWCEPCKQLSPVLERLVAEASGRLVLAKIDIDQSPQLQQAFQVQSVPTVMALIGGRPAPLFTGVVDEAQVRDVFAQVLQVAAQQGVAGQVPAGAADDSSEQAAPLPPLHQAAFDALERGDFDAAVAAFEKAIASNPRDRDAVAGLANVRLLQRLSLASADEIRARAAAQPNDIDAQCAVADLDLSGGHVDDAFARLLDLVAATAGDDRTSVRLRLLDLFEIVGLDDPRVAVARKRLTALLY